VTVLFESNVFETTTPERDAKAAAMSKDHSPLIQRRKEQMRTKRWYLTLSFVLLLVIAPACHVSFTTANISSLKLGKDKSVSQPTTSFEPTDKIYAVAEISNAPGALKVKGRLIVDAVEGQKSGPIPGMETIVDLTGSGQATFTFSAPTAGWPKGTYKIEVLMLESNGEQKDQKTATFSVS
jgi:hypothetical protein